MGFTRKPRRMRSLRSIETFVKRYGPFHGMKYGPTSHDIREITEEVLGWANVGKSGTGKGSHLIFPLTSAGLSADFTKGLFHVLAPDARVSVLVTPRASLVSLPESKQNLRRHLEKVIQSDSKRVVIVDEHTQFRTFDAIRDILADRKIKIEWRDLGHLFLFLHHFSEVKAIPTWEKTPLGEMAADTANVARYVAKRTAKIDREADEPFWINAHKTGRRKGYLLGMAVAYEYLRSRKHQHP